MKTNILYDVGYKFEKDYLYQFMKYSSCGYTIGLIIHRTNKCINYKKIIFEDNKFKIMTPLKVAKNNNNEYLMALINNKL